MDKKYAFATLAIFIDLRTSFLLGCAQNRAKTNTLGLQVIIYYRNNDFLMTKGILFKKVFVSKSTRFTNPPPPVCDLQNYHREALTPEDFEMELQEKAPQVDENMFER